MLTTFDPICICVGVLLIFLRIWETVKLTQEDQFKNGTVSLKDYEMTKF